MTNRLYKVMMDRANTPLKRTGLITLSLSLLLLLYTAIHFQFTKNDFFYWVSHEVLVKESVAPSITPEGHYWENINSQYIGFIDKRMGWYLHHEGCKQRGHRFEPLDWGCDDGIEFIPHETKLKNVLENNFDEYFDEMSLSRSYYNLNRFNIFLVVLGFSLWFGWIVKLINWIKSGE